jgi:NDP-sugar pyrophosphorylase family protein
MDSELNAVVLAAGKGTRLGSLTADAPKPMLDICGRPLIEHIVRHLAGCGVRRLGVNLCTMGDQIRDHLGDGSRFGVSVHYSEEAELRGTAGALPAFLPWLGDAEDLLVVYGDILTDQDPRELFALRRRHDAFASLLVHKRLGSNSFLALDDNGRIESFVERPDTAMRERLAASGVGFYVNSAVQVLSRRSLSYICESGAFDLPRDVYMPNVHSEALYALPLQGKRVAIDSDARYRLAIEMVARGSSTRFKEGSSNE